MPLEKPAAKKLLLKTVSLPLVLCHLPSSNALPPLVSFKKAAQL